MSVNRESHPKYRWTHSLQRTSLSSLEVVASLGKWATTWQNQQNECAPSEDSDQPGHPPNLIRVLTVCMKKHWVLSYQLSTVVFHNFWKESCKASLESPVENRHWRNQNFIVHKIIVNIDRKIMIIESIYKTLFSLCVLKQILWRCLI